jgi:D-arabinose 1-dehydrogenase-like Zn-dependent alcohol dehydrogenase
MKSSSQRCFFGNERNEREALMYAIRIHSYGGPDVMRGEELPVPTPGPGQVLVRVEAASVNFLDVQKPRGELVGQSFYRRSGAGEPDLPATLGSQGVGVVEGLGPDVRNVPVGACVVFAGDSYATHALAPAAWLIPVPDGLGIEQAAAGMNQGFLAYALTHFAYPVKPGDWCLIQTGGWWDRTSALADGKYVGAGSSVLPRPGRKPNLWKRPAPTRLSFPNTLISRRRQGESPKAAG